MNILKILLLGIDNSHKEDIISHSITNDSLRNILITNYNEYNSTSKHFLLCLIITIGIIVLVLLYLDCQNKKCIKRNSSFHKKILELQTKDHTPNEIESYYEKLLRELERDRHFYKLRFNHVYRGLEKNIKFTLDFHTENISETDKVFLYKTLRVIDLYLENNIDSGRNLEKMVLIVSILTFTMMIINNALIHYNNKITILNSTSSSINTDANYINTNATKAGTVATTYNTDASCENTSANIRNTDATLKGTLATYGNTDASCINTEASKENTDASCINTDASYINTEASERNTDASIENTKASENNTDKLQENSKTVLKTSNPKSTFLGEYVNDSITAYAKSFILCLYAMNNSTEIFYPFYEKYNFLKDDNIWQEIIEISNPLVSH